MRRPVKILVTSLILATIMIFSITGTVMAQGPYGPQYGECPNPDCPNAGECPNPDCPNVNMTLVDGSGTQTQSQTCNTACNQQQVNKQFGGNGNCEAYTNCWNNQYQHGTNSEE